MGMGEPLNNADRVFSAVRLLNTPGRLGIGARHITVSTSGVVPGIERMVDELPQVNLAISLHAPDDRLRDELVPINRKWPIAEVIAAGRRFADRTRRRVSLEYVLIDGVNDSIPLAQRLGALASGWLCHVNLIPLNPTPGSRWSGTPPAGIAAFASVLRAAGVPVTVRDTRGRQIVKNITIGPLVVEAIREHATVPVHSHLMISEPQRYASAFAEAGSDLIVFHVEADDDPEAVINAIRASGRSPGMALSPETPAAAVLPFLESIDLLLVMTVHPGWGGQAFIHDVLPKLSGLRAEIERRGLSLPVGVDGGVNLETIGPAYAAGGELLVTGSALFAEAGDLRPAVDAFRAAAIGGAS